MADSLSKIPYYKCLTVATQRDPHPEHGGGITWDESKANARLIAAAPALLAALDYLQSSPNDPRAHRAALDALALAR